MSEDKNTTPELEETERVILCALGNYRGDDLQRARAAFRGFGAAQMDQEHGQSGKTRREILDEYEKHDARVTAASRWVVAQLEQARADHE